MFKINKWFLVFVFAVFVNFVAILFYMNARDGMHVDEQFSYGHSNSSRGGFIFDGIDHHFGDSKDINNKWIDANIYMNYFSVSSKNRFSYGNIVENLRKDVHPPLYYVILHTISSVFYGEFNKWFGLGINLVLFWLIAFGIYKLNKLIIGDDKYALVCFCLWGMSNIGVSTILFIRMYALQTFLLTMLIYETGKIVKENRVSNSGLCLVFLYSALGILTQYNSIFFSFFLAVSTGCVLLIRKNYSLLIKYSIVMLLSILTLFIVFEPAYDVLLKSQRSKGAFENSLFMLEDPLLIFDMEFYRFLKIFMYDFWNIDNSINFVLLSMVIIVFRWFNFRKYLLKDKKIKVLCNLSFIMLLFFAFFGPIGALFLLFLFEKSKYLILKVENKEKIDGEKAKSQYIIGWSLGCILPSTIFIFVIMPFMGEYETRYIMAIMPFVTVLNIYILIKTGNYFKLTKNKLYVFLLCLVIFNGMITNFYKESVFRFRNTIETNNFMKNIKNKDVFVVSHEKEPLLFFERGYYLKDAKRVYLEPKLTDENLIKEINNNRQDMYVLVLEQSYIDSFWGKPSFMEKNPRMKDVLKFVSKIVLSERGYDLYQIK